MKTIYNIFRSGLALLAMSCVLSCHKNNAPSAPLGQIVFRSHSGFSVSAETKATVVDQAALVASGFNVSATQGEDEEETAVWTNASFSMGEDYFQADESKWWPSTDPGYHFYASTFDLTHTAAGATISATNDSDVVCAYLPDPTYNEVNNLAFKHIFARIGDVTFTAVNGYTITDISVTIVPNTGGTYNLRTGAGQTDGTGWSNLTAAENPVVIADTSPGTQPNDLYLVPGTYTVTATWTATKGDYTKTFAEKTCDLAIAGGAVNTITAQLTGDATEVTFAVTVTPWTGHDIDLGIYEF